MVCPSKVMTTVGKITIYHVLIMTRIVSRPYLHIYKHSNELEETGIVSLSGVNVESDPHKEILLGVGPLDIMINQLINK